MILLESTLSWSQFPAPTPTIADAGDIQKKSLRKDYYANITAKDTQANVIQEVVIGTPCIPGGGPCQIGDLIADTSARVRLDKHTREPVRHTPRGNLWGTPIFGDAQL